ncbi:unnamed protein product [Acanthoscelides obtectus]|uniref:SCP domain-containing protein n=1 Tax=Acanthoscelides obtectus TaxID=200917 RepID=A0A9P0JTZ2_ACAOB|nr:unnamed protein product [Acanthoscelides obtectus]CAK1642192.1 Cysteine-rich secretory protein 2 [Acanthoscelides obtectus]
MSQKTIYILAIVMAVVHEAKGYGRIDFRRRPRLMGDKISLTSLDPRRMRVQQKIVIYHNAFRSKVRPTAANMLKMKWHTGAARTAQRWADQCLVLEHDNETGRYDPNYGACGQNIFISSHKVPWLFAIETWWLEKNIFRYGGRNELHEIGHYTQMVWASTHEVGCGIAKCNHEPSSRFSPKVFYNYVCNYCPIGNHARRLSIPYKIGEPCSLCKQHCKRNLCLNSCPYADYWVNCGQLHRAFPNWVCNTSTPQGRDRFRKCRATCVCRHKIK